MAVTQKSPEQVWEDFKVNCKGLEDQGEAWYNHSEYIFKEAERQLAFCDARGEEEQDKLGVEMVRTLSEKDTEKLHLFLYEN